MHNKYINLNSQLVFPQSNTLKEDVEDIPPKKSVVVCASF